MIRSPIAELPDYLLTSDFEKKLSSLIKTAIKENVFPCAAVGIALGSKENRKSKTFVFGSLSNKPNYSSLKNTDFFDLASLTKPLSTTLSLLCLIKEKKISLNDPLAVLLKKDIPADKKNITLRQLLSHSSGLPAYQPYFEKLIQYPLKERKELLEKLILQEPLSYQLDEKSAYSDLGFLLLGGVVEKQAQMGLDEFIKERVYEPLGLNKKLFYKPIQARKVPLKGYVPTEKCPWRKKLLCGEVHDDNAHCIGGVAGHAGLFGDIGGVIKLTTFILDLWKGNQSHVSLSNTALQYFLTRQKSIPASTWALGFDTPSERNSSSGKFFSNKSVGHLGYTGTSFWIDPEKDLIITLLTNRVHPTRENKKIRAFRPLFHDHIVETLGLL